PLMLACAARQRNGSGAVYGAANRAGPARVEQTSGLGVKSPPDSIDQFDKNEHDPIRRHWQPEVALTGRPEVCPTKNAFTAIAVSDKSVGANSPGLQRKIGRSDLWE